MRRFALMAQIKRRLSAAPRPVLKHDPVAADNFIDGHFETCRVMESEGDLPGSFLPRNQNVIRNADELGLNFRSRQKNRA